MTTRRCSARPSRRSSAPATGTPALELHERAVALAQRSRAGDEAAADELAELVAGLSVAEAEVLIRSLTRWFQLLNLAEDNERVRRLRARGDDEPAAPCATPSSACTPRGVAADELAETLAAAELRLVLTAHPTEARRRTTIEKLARIFGTLRELDERRDARRADARSSGCADIVQELWGSDDVRTVALDVADEVQGGLDYLSTTLARAVPAVYRELEAAVAEVYPGEDVAVPPLLTFGSWMGGDRDGNPNVTPEVTVQTLDAMRTACLRFLEERGSASSAGRLSLSSRVTGVPERAGGAGRRGRRATSRSSPPSSMRRHPEEPYRRAFSLMRARGPARPARARAGGYAGPSELLDDLRVAERALQSPHGALRRRRRPARPDPPGRGVRLPLRAASTSASTRRSTATRSTRSSPSCGCTSPTTTLGDDERADAARARDRRPRGR